VAAIGIPRFFPGLTARRVVRAGFLAMTAGILVLIGGISPDSGAGIVLFPMLLMGLGIGALASQLGALTVAAVPDSDERRGGGLQNTGDQLRCVTRHGPRRGSADRRAHHDLLAGAGSNSAIPRMCPIAATVQLTGGVPFVSDAQLRSELATTTLSKPTQDAIVAENATARIAACGPRCGCSPCAR